jgi:hypothetical protein
LLHSLIERYARHTTQIGAEVFRPRRTLLELIAEWAQENASNPRIESKTLAGQVRIEEILRSFAEVCTHVRRPVRQPVTAISLARATRVLDGPEIWLKDPESKLCGRADFISSGEIVDFKSGEKQDYHAEQLAFYGALYLALTGRVPSSFRLIYTGTNESREVPVPTVEKLEFMLEEMRRRSASADRQVANGEFPAKPEATKCMYCHVRGFCDAYWKSVGDQGQNANANQGGLVDYSPTAAARTESAAFGIYIRDNLSGVSSVLHIPQEAMDRMGDPAETLRVLALRAISSAEGVRFAFTQSSEVYVK